MVVLHSVQPIGCDLGAAFPAERFVVRVLTDGAPQQAIRPWVPSAVPIEVLPSERWEEWLREIAGAEPLELVTNDEYCLERCAALRRELGLPPRLQISFAAYRDKVLMKDALAAAGLAVPAFLPLDPVPGGAAATSEIFGALGPRIVVKPRREANNRGVEAIGSVAVLERWLGEHAGERGWEAEAFVEGTMFHADGLVEDSDVTPLLVGEYVGSPLALEVGGAIGSITTAAGSAAVVQGEEMNGAVVAALGGGGRFVIHTEFIREPSGRPVFLETAARAPGGLISDISLLRRGVHLEQLNLRLQAGLLDPVPSVTGDFAAWLWFPRPTKDAAAPVALRCGHRLDSLPAPYPIAHSLLAWDPDPELLRREVIESGSTA